MSWLLVVIAVLAVLVGLYIWLKSRNRPRPPRRGPGRGAGGGSTGGEKPPFRHEG